MNQLVVELEQGIATTSIAPGSGEDDVQHEWEEGDDQDFHFDWDYQP